MVRELHEQSRVLVEEVHQVEPLDHKDLALLQRYDGCSQQIVGDDTIQFPEEGARSIKFRDLLLRAINELELSFGQQERKLCRFTHRPQDLVLFDVDLLEDHLQLCCLGCVELHEDRVLVDEVQRLRFSGLKQREQLLYERTSIILLLSEDEPKVLPLYRQQLTIC